MHQLHSRVAPCTVISQHRLDPMVFAAAVGLLALRERTCSRMGRDVKEYVGGDEAGERQQT